MRSGGERTRQALPYAAVLDYLRLNAGEGSRVLASTHYHGLASVPTCLTGKLRAPRRGTGTLKKGHETAARISTGFTGTWITGWVKVGPIRRYPKTPSWWRKSWG